MEVNITLVSLLVIILLFIPGFFFKRFYFIGKFTKQFTAGTFAERFITNIFWGIVVQIICLWIVSQVVKKKYSDIRLPINTFYAQLSESKLPECDATDFKYGMLYVFGSVAVACLLGFFLHTLVRTLKIDVRYTVFRFANYWNYYFKGDIPGMRSNKKGKVASTVLDIIAEDGKGGTRMYKGFLAEYEIVHGTGDLETITLLKAERWSKTRNGYIAIPGDTLVVPYSKVINMNITYNTVQRNLAATLGDSLAVLSIFLFGFSFYFLIKNYTPYIGWVRTIFSLIDFLIVTFFALSAVILLFVPTTGIRVSSTAKITVKNKLAAFTLTIFIASFFSLVLFFLLRHKKSTIQEMSSKSFLVKRPIPLCYPK